MLWSSSRDAKDNLYGSTRTGANDGVRRDGAAEEDDTTNRGCAGIYKWAMDALFGMRMTPSKKFLSQDDTNYKLRGNRHKREQKRYARSTSWHAPDNFHQEYDLLPSRSPSIVSESPSGQQGLVDSYVPADPPINKLRSPARLQSSKELPLARSQSPTNTFAFKQGQKPRSHKWNRLKVPDASDPLLSRLFQKSKTSDEQPSMMSIPGKFPSPMKKSEKDAEYLSRYMELFTHLDQMNMSLEKLDNDLEAQQEQWQQEGEHYKRKYTEIRKQFINEMKRSKHLYDDYYKLSMKYRDLKKIAKDAVDLQDIISKLKTETLSSGLQNENLVRELSDQVIHWETLYRNLRDASDSEAINYERRIRNLERELAYYKSLHGVDGRRFDDFDVISSSVNSSMRNHPELSSYTTDYSSPLRKY